MKLPVEVDSGAMIYIPSLIKIGSAIQELIGGTHKLTFSFLNKASKLKRH
jgi:hypothetical protein